MPDRREDRFECEYCGCLVVGSTLDDLGMAVGVGLAFSVCPNCGKPVRQCRDEILESRMANG